MAWAPMSLPGAPRALTMAHLGTSGSLVPSSHRVSLRFCRATGGAWSSRRTGPSWPQGTCVSRPGYVSLHEVAGRWEGKRLLAGGSTRQPGLDSVFSGSVWSRAVAESLPCPFRNLRAPPLSVGNLPTGSPSWCSRRACVQPVLAAIPSNGERAAGAGPGPGVRPRLSCRAPRGKQGKERWWTTMETSTRLCR